MALKIDWSDEARDDIRALDRASAMLCSKDFSGPLRLDTAISKRFTESSKAVSGSGSVTTAFYFRPSPKRSAFTPSKIVKMLIAEAWGFSLHIFRSILCFCKACRVVCYAAPAER
jgi:hypothetical protein